LEISNICCILQVLTDTMFYFKNLMPSQLQFLFIDVGKTVVEGFFNSMSTKTEAFINKAIKKHGNLYDYSHVVYLNSKTPIDLKCIKHDKIFTMLPYNHLAGKGCKECGYIKSRIKFKKTNELFIKEANEKHENKYNYDLIDYVNAKVKVKIICPDHGLFEQTPDNHLNSKTKGACPKCTIIKRANSQRLTLSEFIKRCDKIHNNKYDYSKFDYQGDKIKSIIICPIHGEFKQAPQDHYRSGGCNLCGNLNTSKYQRENPNGWSYETWIKKAKISKFFDCFKVYIIKCWDENEVFYKIGRTFTTVKYRFRFKSQLPYKYEILKEIIGNPKDIVNLELKLKNEHKSFKYTPNKKFDGKYECYKQINDINGINI